MFSLTKILLPVDYSEPGMAVARQAIGLAEHFCVEITVLHVLAPVSDVIAGTFHTFEGRLAIRRRSARAQMDKFLRAHLRHVRVRPLLREGDPATEILRQAAQDGSDLIMMPTHGFNACRRILLGSVAAKCLHEAVCPVWAGPHRPRASNLEAPSLSHIVCAIVLGSDGSIGLEWASGLAGEFHSALTVLNLAPRADLPTEENCEYPWRRHVLGDDFAAIPDLPQHKVRSQHILVETGDITRTVPLVAERLNADLLVLDRIPWDPAHLSIDAYGIIRSSSCSILRL